MLEYQDTLKEELQDEDYRYAYAEDFLNTLIATQIKVLREQRKLTQQELAKLTGTKQAGISRLENVNYSAWKTETLRKLARALGVRLRITFETFGTLLDDGARFSPGNLQRPEFADDPVFQEQFVGSTSVKESVSPNTIAFDGDMKQTNNVAASIGTSHGAAGEVSPDSQLADATAMPPKKEACAEWMAGPQLQ